jgi:Fe-S oxidoreductase/nitrate reductase gamma subunit
MSLVLVAGFGIFAYSARKRWLVLRAGAPADRLDRIPERLQAVWRYAFAQERMHRYPAAGAAHLAIFVGFLVLLLRTVILWGRGYDEHFHLLVLGADQPLGKAYGLLKDIFVLAVIAGVLVFFYYRLVRRLERMTLSGEGVLILGIILAMMMADLVYDGTNRVREARHTGAVAQWSGWEPAGSTVGLVLAGLPDGSLNALRHAGFWTHSILVLVFLNLLPYSKHFHIITAIPNVFLQNLDPPGHLVKTDDMEGKVERGETLGIARIAQFSWKSMLDFYTCTECGRCTDFCPAANTGKKLSPKHFTLDLRNHVYRNQDALIAAGGDVKEGENGLAKPIVPMIIDPEVVWACTTCRACEQECPVFISYVDKFIDVRRHLVQEQGEFPHDLATAFRGLENAGNPWGLPAQQRREWSEGLKLPRLAEKPEAKYLLWVGCAAAYDERARKIARATAQLLVKAGVNFAVLGEEETCTGDPARRAGNEFLFQIQAQANVEVLNGYGVKRIITICPHCYNTLGNEYGDFGGKYEVVHHSELLARLVAEGRLTPTRRVEAKVVYHDACYLGRYNGVYEQPRDILRRIPGVELVEATENRDRGMCCGAGGAQFFKEEEPGRERVNTARTTQLLNTGATVMASACPFCMRMLTDGLAAKDRTDVKQMDLAEVLWEAVRVE